MTVTKTMRVGRKKNPNKMIGKTIIMEKSMFDAIEARAGKGKTSAWLREIVERELSLS